MNEQYTMEEWMGIMQEAGMDEGRLSRLAAGLGLGAAALAGGAKDADAQSAPPQAAIVPNDSVQTGVSRDMGYAQRKAEFELDRKKIDRQGARMTPVQNKDGTWSVTIDARKQPPATEKPEMDEQYTIEEWMGMMEEVGYSLEEANKERFQVQHHHDYGYHVAPVRTFATKKGADFHRKQLDIQQAKDEPFHPEFDDPADYLESGYRVRKVGSDVPVGAHLPTYVQVVAQNVGKRLPKHPRARREFLKKHDPSWMPLTLGKAARQATGVAGSGTPDDDEAYNDKLYPKNDYSRPREDDDYDIDYPRRPTPAMKEQYTIEEWMGMMEEAGFNLNERNMDNKRAKDAFVRQQGQQAIATGTVTGLAPSQLQQRATDPTKAARQDTSAGRAFNNPDTMARMQKQGSVSMGMAHSDRQSAHARTQSGRHSPEQQHNRQNRPGVRYNSQVSGRPNFGGMDAARDGAVYSKADRLAADKYGFSGGNRELVDRGKATKDRLSTARAERGASVPGTVDFVQDKERMRVGKKPRMEEQYTLEEWVDLMEGANQILSEQESHMEDQYTLEEWMGMMEEAGFNLNELSPDEIEAQKNSPEARLKASWRSHRAEGPVGATGPYFRASDGSVQPVSRTVGAVDRRQPRGVTKTQNREAELRFADRVRAGRLSPDGGGARGQQAHLKSRLQAAGVTGYNRPYIDASVADKQDMDRQISTTLAQPRLKKPIAPKGFDDSGVPVVAESINENTVSRLQELAGIKPLNG